MEFLVNIRISWPLSITEEEKAAINKREVERAAELASQGHLVRMWRVPGRLENWGLWKAADPTELHAILTSLPVWPFMSIDVHALAKHAVDPANRTEMK